MATKPQAAFDRIQAANNNTYNATTNPGGLANGGHRQNLVPDFQAMVDVANYTADLAAEVEDDAERFEAAVAAIEAGPVSSVVGKSGIVTAAQIAAAIGFDAAQETTQNTKLAALADRATALEDYRSPFTFAYAFR